MADLILVHRAGPIATVVLNRPDKLNALTKAMWRGLGETIDARSADDTLRCVILRGAGEKAFAPGNDIAEIAPLARLAGAARRASLTGGGALPCR